MIINFYNKYYFHLSVVFIEVFTWRYKFQEIFYTGNTYLTTKPLNINCSVQVFQKSESMVTQPWVRELILEVWELVMTWETISKGLKTIFYFNVGG